MHTPAPRSLPLLALIALSFFLLTAFSVRLVRVGAAGTNPSPATASPNKDEDVYRPLAECSSLSFSKTGFATGEFPVSVAVGDFNGHGKRDIATANKVGLGNVSVLLGTGTGGFGAANNFAVGNTASSGAVGDFNNDGKSDLAV